MAGVLAVGHRLCKVGPDALSDGICGVFRL